MSRTRQRILIFGLILLGLLFAGFFGIRSLRAVKKYEEYRPPPLLPADSASLESDVELIRDSMTIPYISTTYNLPPNLLYKALTISPRGNEEKSLSQLNEEYFPESPGFVIEIVKAAVRASLPSPTVSPPKTAVP